MKRITYLCYIGLLAAAPLWAQSEPETQEKLKALEERVRALETELLALKSALASAAPAGPAQQAVAPAAATPPAGEGTRPQGGIIGGAPQNAKLLNPDVSVIGNFLGSVGRNRVRPVPALEMAETEVGFQAIIDPYARGDFFISFGEEGVELEEGYITFTALPLGVVARVGKMRSAFGKVNLLHSHNLPWIDRPLVTENLAGGEEGIGDAGLSFSRILPAPGGIFLEGTAQVFRGDSGDIFLASRRSDASVVGHLRGYGDITESTNIDLGFSYARGHNDQGSAFLTNLYGVDATFRWKPLRRAIYNSFIWRTEFIWSRRDEPGGLQRAFGWFTAADFRVNRRWTLGGRFDRAGQAASATATDNGFSALVTFWPSEFTQLRSQYRLTRYDGGRNANELRFQALFVLGAHGAHPF